jgi:hypothetical protein
MFVLDLDYKVHIKGHGWNGSWMKMVCPSYLLCKEKEVLSMSANVGNPNATSEMALASTRVNFLLPSQSQNSSSPFLTTDFGKVAMAALLRE